EVTSNRIRCDTLYQAGEARDRVDRVLEKLVEARLVRLTEGQTLADAQIEVAHEALVRNWPRLVDWLDEERVEMRRRLRLTAAAEQWDALGRDPGALLRGASLEEARGYEDLNELEAAFVQSSQEAAEEARRREEEARQRELQQARERAEEQARAARRLRLALVALAAFFLSAVGAGVLVIRQTQENARLAIAATAEAGNAAAAVTQAAAKEALVAALDAQATAVAQLATAEVRGEQVLDAQATAQASQATAVAAREADQAREATAVAARKTAQAVVVTPFATPAPSPTLSPTATDTLGPIPTPTFSPAPTSTRTPTVTATPTVPAKAFELVYLGCQPHTSDLGSVKGQVFDTTGTVIPGAQVEILINGQRWDDPANPAKTNEEGWYEWVLGTGQVIRFVALYVDAERVSFASGVDPVEVEARAGCFQHVNFRQK
ncbi:MAG: hypothetical protein JSV36_09680, partial [Anaerolineae bacterium]